MGLFDKIEKKEEENKLIFGQKKGDENGGRNLGRNIGGNGTSGGTESRKHDSNRGNDNNGGNEPNGGNTGGGLFQLSIADSVPSNGDTGNTIPIDGANGHISLTNSEIESKSNAEEKHSGRPSFLSFGQGKKEEKKEEKNKDVRIKKGSQGKRKKGEYMSDEQVEILFVSLFDAFALFRGEHWKVQENEKHIIPSLTRIMNRMLEILPKGVANSAFNIADYIIVIGAIAGMILTRIKIEKGSLKYVQEEPKRTGTIAATNGNTIQGRNERDHENSISTIAEPSERHQRNENGKSILAPIGDLTKSINRIS